MNSYNPTLGPVMPEQAQHPGARFVGTIHVPLALNPISLNARLHWRVKARHTKTWREFAGLAAARYPELGACDVTLTWFVTDKRRRDEDNLYLLLKALCDGLVDAGVVVDDTADLMGKRCRIEPAPAGTKTAYMELKVESRSKSDAARSLNSENEGQSA